MISLNSLTKKDIGKNCWYKSFGKPEYGIIKSWNDTFVFVVYPGNNDSKKDHWDRYTAAATKPGDLFWTEKEANE